MKPAARTAVKARSIVKGWFRPSSRELKGIANGVNEKVAGRLGLQPHEVTEKFLRELSKNASREMQSKVSALSKKALKQKDGTGKQFTDALAQHNAASEMLKKVARKRDAEVSRVAADYALDAVGVSRPEVREKILATILETADSRFSVREKQLEGRGDSERLEAEVDALLKSRWGVLRHELGRFRASLFLARFEHLHLRILEKMVG